MGGPGKRGGGAPGGGPPIGIWPIAMLDLWGCGEVNSDCIGGFGSASGCGPGGSNLAPASWPVNLQSKFRH